jgi:hypothetical protein
MWDVLGRKIVVWAKERACMKNKCSKKRTGKPGSNGITLA